MSPSEGGYKELGFGSVDLALFQLHNAACTFGSDRADQAARSLNLALASNIHNMSVS